MSAPGASAPGASTAGREPLSPRQRKALVAGAIGNAVEWVDWAVYGTFSAVFAGQFFPSEDPAAALLSTLAVFAVGFVMRPVGGALLGAYADRHGRKAGLTLTISLMAASAAVIAVVPPYAVIGLWAPVVLLLCRLVQGFSAGGEFGTSSAFLVESAARGGRAFAGSWQQVSVGAGVLVASLMGVLLTNLLSEESLAVWGWRVAFGVGALLGLVGLWLRVSVEETDAFTQSRDAGQAPGSGARRGALAGMLRDHPRAALRVAGITVAGTLTYYIWVSYMPGFASSASGIPLADAFLANTIAVAVFLVLLPFGGRLSDRVGRKPTMLAFAVGFLVIAWPAFRLLQSSDGFWTLLAVELVGVVLLVGYSANCAVVMAEQFPAAVRTTGIGLPYALSVAVFGGTAPYITTWLTTSGRGDLIWLYVAAAAVVGIAVYATMPETKDGEMA